jgi:hypothetical protein
MDARKITTIISLSLMGASLICGLTCYCVADRTAQTARMKELESLLERAESATRLKRYGRFDSPLGWCSLRVYDSAFVSTISHELRVPLTGNRHSF